jgi:hypothetical protein
MKTLFIILFFVSITAFSQNSNCKCFNSKLLELKGAQPEFVFKLKNNQELNLCGFIQKKSENEWIGSDFAISDCQNGKLIIESSTNSVITYDSNTLSIIEMRFLRTGENWTEEIIPISFKEIYSRKDSLKISTKRPRLKKGLITKNRIDTFFIQMEEKIKKGESVNIILTLEKLETLSVIGNQKAFEFLLNFKSFFDLKENELYESKLKESIELSLSYKRNKNWL